MIKKIFTLLCLCTLCIGSAWGNIIYEKVTSSLSDWSGEYLIVYESNNVAFDGSLTDLDATPNTFSVTISNNVITLSDADATAKQFTITAAETSGEYYIKSASGYYIWGTSSNGISSNTSISKAKTNTISYSNNTFTIKGKEGSRTLSFNTASNQLKFRYLQSTLIQLYKKQSGTPSKTLTSIEVSGTPTKTTYKEGEEFDPTGLTVTGTYSDASTAEITSGIDWTFNPNPLTAGTTSVSVTAKVGDVTSPAYMVYYLTVTEKPVLPSYTLVTDASTLMDGDVIVLGAVKDDTWYVNAGINGKYLDKADATCKDDILESEKAVEITLEETTDGWYLKIENQYINTTAARALTFANDASTVWTIDIDKNGLATIAAGDYGRFLYNVNSPRFLNYTSSTDASMLLPKIFKKETAPASADVTISDAGWATACLPFNATISDNATAYYVTTSGRILNKVEANVIPAGEGVLLKSNEGIAATVTFTESAVAADVVEANYMKGSVAGETFDESGYKYYILANDETKGLGFYFKVEGGASVECAAGKAVLAVPNSASPAKEGFSFDEPTGIESLTPALSEGKGVYNLNGMRVNGSYKGIVIMNGKKYINK